MKKKRLDNYFKDVDTANNLLNASISLFFKSILTYSIAALGLFFTLLVQFFKDKQITENIICDVLVAVILLCSTILLIFLSMLIDQKSINYSLYIARYYLYYNNTLKNRWVYVFYIFEVLVLILSIIATVFMVRVYISLIMYNV